MLDRLLDDDKKDTLTWYWQLTTLPNAPESRYLYALLASNEFQEGLKNYRELNFMSRNLDGWREDVSAFDDMLDTRQEAYKERVPKADAVMAATDLDGLTQKRVDFESRINEIEKSNDVAALGTPEEQRTWQRLKRIEDYLAAHPDDPDLAEMREKLRLMKGVMYWRLSSSFKARLWNERRSVKELEAELKETQKRAVLVRQARAGVPTNTGVYAERIADIRARMDQLQQRLADVSATAEPISCRRSPSASSRARSSASRLTRFRRAMNWRRFTTTPRTTSRRRRSRERASSTPAERASCERAWAPRCWPPRCWLFGRPAMPRTRIRRPSRISRRSKSM